MSSTTETHFVRSGGFATTRWTIIAAARDADSPGKREAWEELARRYWRPVHACIPGRWSFAGEAEDFEVLKPHLMLGRAEADHARLAAELGVAEGAARVALHRLRERLRGHFRAEVAETVDEEGELEAELRHVVALLGQK